MSGTSFMYIVLIADCDRIYLFKKKTLNEIQEIFAIN